MCPEGHLTGDYEPSAAESDLIKGCLLNALPFFSELGLQGLACLGVSSSTFRDACLYILQNDAAKLLTSDLDAAVADATLQNPPAVKQQHLHAAVWLLRQAPSAATATATTERLLQLPAMPEEWAQQLVGAGVRILYAQLLAAADSMRLGVEEWVCAQQYLGFFTDIPAAAVAVCCGRPAMYQLMVSASTAC
jgi:hypothetical protein